MSRMTRAKAAAVAEQLHIDEDALLELNAQKDDLVAALSQTGNRGALRELSPNSVSSNIDEEAEVEREFITEPKETGDKRAWKGTDNDTLNASSTSATGAQLPEVMPDEHEVAQSPASKAASDDLVANVPEFEASHLPLHDNRATTPPSDAVKLASSQSRGSPSALQLDAPNLGSEATEVTQSTGQETNQDGKQQQRALQTTTEYENPQVPSADALVSDDMPNLLQIKQADSAQRPSTPQAETGRQSSMDISNVENVDPNGKYDQLEKAVVDASTPPRSKSKSPRIPAPKPTYDQLEIAALNVSRSSSSPPSPKMPEDAIEALDFENDALEQVTAQVPDVQDSPQKPKSRKAAPLVRTTKASQARISLAHGLPDAPSKAPAMGRPRQSLSQSTGKRITSTSSMKSNGTAADDSLSIPEKKEVIIPHSKPRPMSMQFKPPPPPAKSTKAPTQSTFQLPGEAVAAKLKAAKEARMQKEAEESKKKAFKARPAPSMTKAPAVRQTSTSKARESLMNGSGNTLATSTGPSAARPVSVASSRPTTSGRPSTSFARPTSSARPASSLKTSRSRPSTSGATKTTGRPSTAMGSSVIRNRPRPSTAMALSNNRPRTSLALKPNPPAAATSSTSTSGARPPAFQAGKGKEVFQRTAQAKNSAEAAKREKEEAAKKARAEAAERSRALSREWAEKQKAKKMGGAGAKAAPANPATTTGLKPEDAMSGIVESIETA
ncbi:unnamed protein product [Cercospora beticola]|nr:unnamed protein product [Cercospora beticola]